MGISEAKKKIVIDNYFRAECNINTTIKDAFTRGFELGLKKAPAPQPKTGHWMEKYVEDGCGELYLHWVCSECGRSVGYNLANIEDVLSDYPYCHCGAKMKECK